MLVGMVLYTNLGGDRCATRADRAGSIPCSAGSRSASPDRSRKSLFLIAMLVVALAIPYSLLATPLDVVLPPAVAADGRAGSRLWS